LRKLCEVAADYDRRIELAIETKHPTRYSGLVEKRVVEVLRDFGWDRAGTPARVMSFSFTALQRVERLAPEVPVVMLMERAQYWPALRRVIGKDWL
ncbi:glycerophosphodiester phosphodiesterase, partial [Nocardioides sp. SOB77]|nr:glycerophosphodiester phosphodiesterase [Nocardioides oceani]